MKFACVVFFMVLANSLAYQCSNRRSNTKLLCYYSEVTDINTCMCTHIILPANSDARTINSVQQNFKGGNVLLTVNEFNEDLVNVLKNNKIDGLEVNLKKLHDKNDVVDFISTVKSKLGSDLLFAVSLPPRAEVLAKYYDLKALTKHADLFILQTAFLGASQNVTFHPSRLSGVWDMQNTDSVVDLVTGMGAPLSKLVITAPVQAYQFTLQDEGHTAPGGPALEIKSLTRDQLCNKMSRGFNWTLERDQDQAGPYIFRKNLWIAFDDAASMDIKAKYTRVRGLAGLALKDLSQDGGENCGGALLKAAHSGLSKQSRAPRGAVLQSLEREILETPSRPLDTIQISPYRISRVIDVEGNVHSIRQDTRTEFECARQGYFVHPRSCGRFYRCVKFDQLADDFSVFEFDCPDGLSFDSRYEVCVWPGSLSYSSPCSGSSEIAPVPRTRFVCPQAEGYYADPENCRWFFACLDHGKSPMSAYEFRCPFGLVFDESRLLCEWPWLVPKCGSGDAVGFEYDNRISLHGARLETYDGLGALGVVNLGGLSGTVVQPQPKVYTSVVNGEIEVANTGQDLRNRGGGASLSSGNAYSGAIFSPHSNVVGLQQQTSELLKSQGVVGGIHGENYQTNINYRQNAYNPHDVSGYTDSGRQPNSIHVVGSDLTENKRTQTTSFIDHGVRQQQLTSSAVNNQHNQYTKLVQSVGAVQGDNSGQGVVLPVVPVEKIHIVGGFSAVGAGGKSFAEVARKSLNINNIASVTPASPYSKFSILFPSPITPVAAAPVPVVKSDSEAYRGGVVANVPELQYKIVTPSASNVYFQSSFKDNSDYSLSRGIYDSSENVSQNVNINYASSTPTPLALSTASYAYDSPITSFAQGSTASLVTIDQTRADYRGYYYPKPAIAFREEPIKTVTPGTIQSFSFTKYSLNDKAHALNSYVSPKPTEILQPVQPADVLRFSTNTAEESLVAAQPVVSVTPLVPIIQHKITQTNTVQPIISVTPTVLPIVQQKIQPAIVSSYNFQTIAKEGGYQYSKPAVSVKAIQPFVSITPKIHTNEPAIVSSYSFQNSFPGKQGERYQTPNAAFEKKRFQFVQSDQPAGIGLSRESSLSPGAFNQYNQELKYNREDAALQQHTSRFFENQDIHSYLKHGQTQGVTGEIHGASYQTNIDYGRGAPAVISTFSIDSVQKSAPIQPVVSVTPATPVIEHNVVPQVVSVTPIAPTPPQKIHSPVVSSYNFENKVYQYSKPSVSFHNQLTVQPVQPAIVSSFSIHNAQKPLSFVQPVVSVIPTVSTAQQNIQSGIGSSYNFHTGAQNSKTAISFNTQPVQSVAQTVPVIQLPVHAIHPAAISSFSFQNLTKNEGYHYNKQILPVQSVVSITPATTIIKQTLHEQPAILSNYNYQNVLSNNRGYQNIKQTVPVVDVLETVPVIQHRVKPIQPAIVSSYRFHNEASNEGYKYNKEIVPLHPIVGVTAAVPTVQEIVQPAVVSSYSFQNLANIGNQYNKQTLAQPAIVSSYSFQVPNNDGYQYSKQTIPVQPNINVAPVIPIITHKNVQSVQPTITSSYNIHNLGDSEKNKYSKQISLQSIHPVAPTVPTINTPAVTTYRFNNVAENDYSNYFSSEVKPTIPTVVSSFNIHHSAQKDVYNGGYEYRKPIIGFEERPLQATGSVVSVTPLVPVVDKKIQSFTNVEQAHPTQSAAVFSYSYQNVEAAKNAGYNFKTEIKPIRIQSYSYPTPSVAFEEKPRASFTVAFAEPTPQPIVTVSTSRSVVPIINQRVETVVPLTHSHVLQIPLKNENIFINDGNFGEKVSVSTTVKPIIIEDTPVVKDQIRIAHPQSAANLQNYENRQPVDEAPFVAKKAYVTGEKQNQAGYYYSKPVIAFEEGPVGAISTIPSTAKYDEVSTSRKSNPYRGKVSFKTPTYVEDYYYTTLRTNVYTSTPAPFSRSRTNFKPQYSELYSSTPKPSYTSTIATVLAAKTPVQRFQFYDSRLKSPTVSTFSSTENSQFGNKYSFTSIDDQYNPKITVPQPTYISTSTLKYADDSVAISIPKRTYLLINSDNRDYNTASKQSASGSLLKNSVSKPKTYIRVNDFHPFLPAKLGAQCTCTSKTLTLHRKPTAVVPSAYEATSDDGYFVKPTANQNLDILNIPAQNNGAVLENYVYEPNKVSGFSTTPIVVSTPNTILPAPTPTFTIRERVRVGQVTTPTTLLSSAIPLVQVTQAPEVFFKKTVTPAIRVLNEEESRPSQSEFINVNKRLNHVGAKATGGVKEALSDRSFDRYGPGGWRSRQETLQGTIDCQRAGLFRHPEQCNKFYACRWDCTKKRFTLHVFNCPVHLTFDSNLGACNWPSQGPACAGNTLLPNE